MSSTMFGSPSYPSPLDRIRTGRRDRAQQLGLTPHLDISFDANQSFPKTCRTQLKNDSTPIIKTRKSLFKGTGLNDVSFSAGHSKGSFSNSPDRSANTSLGESWSFYNYVGGGQSGVSFPTALRNPNKAICTINARTSEILMANEMACELFEYEESELIGMRLEEMIQLKHKDQRSVTETHLETSGDIVEISGKVVDIFDSSGHLLPVSLWVKPLDCEGEEPRCLVVMEPVERTVATVEFDSDGTILSCDDQLAHLHGYHNPEDVEGMKMNQLIPSFKCPTVGKRMSKDVRKQRATGRTRDGATFPLSIALKLVEELTDGIQANVKRTPLRTRSLNQEVGHGGRRIREPQSCEKEVYVGVVWVFANIQGMITFLPDGTIHSINENFALMLFGYTQQELIGKHISKLIPDFNEVIQGGDNSISIPPSDEDSPMIGRRLNQSDPVVRCSLPKGKMEGEPQYGPISSSAIKQSRLGVGTAALFTGPGVTSTPSRSPATTTKALHNTDLLLKSASEIVGQGKEVKLCEQAPLSLDLGQSDSPRQSHESSVSSDASSKTPTTVRENYPGHPPLSSLSPISMPENFKKASPQTEKPESPLLVLTGTEHLNKFERDFNRNSQQGSESPVWNTMELLAAKIPALDIVSSSSDTDSDQLQKISISRANSGGSRIRQDAEKEDARKSAICSEWLSQNVKVSSSDPNLRQSLPFSPGKSDLVSSLLCGSKMYKRQRRSHGGRLQNTSVCGSGNHVINAAGGQISDYGQKRVSEVSQAGTDGDSGRFSLSQNPLEVTDGSRHQADRRSTNHQAPGKENRPSPVHSRSSGKTKMASTSFSAVPQRYNPLPGGELNSPNAFHQSLNHHSRPEDFEVTWHKRHVPSEDEIVLEKVNQQTQSPKGGNQYFPPFQKEQAWDYKDYLSQFSAVPEGEFCCQGQHRDGTSLGVTFQVKRVDLEDGNLLYAMWLSRDPREPGEGGRSFANLTLASSLNSTMETASFSLGEVLVEKAQSASKLQGNDPIKQYNDNMTNEEGDGDVNTSVEEGVVSLSEGRGLYNENYDTLRCIGKGAFGFVRLARRKDTYQEVVVKFIRRSKVLSEGWVIDEDLGKCPLEISLLSKLHHDNIVKVIDVYDNEDFFQMVMEKHGSGMDLFEFIDRNPNLDEALASYLFRQVANECTADTVTNSIVPIAVGAALAGLVVIVLIAYLIGRRRNHKGYESV